MNFGSKEYTPKFQAPTWRTSCRNCDVHGTCLKRRGQRGMVRVLRRPSWNPAEYRMRQTIESWRKCFAKMSHYQKSDNGWGLYTSLRLLRAPPLHQTRSLHGEFTDCNVERGQYHVKTWGDSNSQIGSTPFHSSTTPSFFAAPTLVRSSQYSRLPSAVNAGSQ